MIALMCRWFGHKRNIRYLYVNTRGDRMMMYRCDRCGEAEHVKIKDSDVRSVIGKHARR